MSRAPTHFNLAVKMFAEANVETNGGIANDGTPERLNDKAERQLQRSAQPHSHRSIL
jgi:hypothetical protein